MGKTGVTAVMDVSILSKQICLSLFSKALDIVAESRVEGESAFNRKRLNYCSRTIVPRKGFLTPIFKNMDMKFSSQTAVFGSENMQRCVRPSVCTVCYAFLTVFLCRQRKTTQF